MHSLCNENNDFDADLCKRLCVCVQNPLVLDIINEFPFTIGGDMVVTGGEPF